MARFTREVQVLASLNHPNIATPHRVEEHALVMELVERASPNGPLPTAAALEYARQVADVPDPPHAVRASSLPFNPVPSAMGLLQDLDIQKRRERRRASARRRHRPERYSLLAAPDMDY